MVISCQSRLLCVPNFVVLVVYSSVNPTSFVSNQTCAREVHHSLFCSMKIWFVFAVSLQTYFKLFFRLGWVVGFENRNRVFFSGSYLVSEQSCNFSASVIINLTPNPVFCG